MNLFTSYWLGILDPLTSALPTVRRANTGDPRRSTISCIDRLKVRRALCSASLSATPTHNSHKPLIMRPTLRSTGDDDDDNETERGEACIIIHS